MNFPIPEPSVFTVVQPSAFMGARRVFSSRLLFLLLLALSWTHVRADLRIPIDVTINGTPVRLAFDTGAGAALALFTETAERLDLAVEPPPPGKVAPGYTKSGYTEPTEVEFEGVVHKNVRIAVLDSAVPLDIEGLVGWPFFSGGVLVINSPHLAVSFRDRLPAEAKSWRKFKMIPGSGTLEFEVGQKVNGKQLHALVDTGDDGGVNLPPEMWRKWRTEHAYLRGTIVAAFYPSTGLVVREVVQASEITIGKLKLYDVPVTGSVSGDRSPTDIIPTVAMGLAALMRMNLAADNTTQRISIAPRKDPSDHAFPFNRLGAVFVPVLGVDDDLVARVAAHTPAAEAGVKDGDLLLKINDLDVTKWRTDPSILPFSKYWERPAGTIVTLALRRGDQNLSITAVLRDLLVIPTSSAARRR